MTITHAHKRRKHRAHHAHPLKRLKKSKGVQWVFRTVHAHPIFKHTHNLAYCVYYGIALAEDHGVQFAVVAVLFCVAVIVALAAEGH